MSHGTNITHMHTPHTDPHHTQPHARTHAVTVLSGVLSYREAVGMTVVLSSVHLVNIVCYFHYSTWLDSQNFEPGVCV